MGNTEERLKDLEKRIIQLEASNGYLNTFIIRMYNKTVTSIEDIESINYYPIDIMKDLKYTIKKTPVWGIYEVEWND